MIPISLFVALTQRERQNRTQLEAGEILWRAVLIAGAEMSPQHRRDAIPAEMAADCPWLLTAPRVRRKRKTPS